MRINNNVMALNAHRQLGMNQTGAAKSMEKLSSGFRINRAGDDAAGLAISEKMRGQIRGLKQATRNAQDGISLIQTAEGALNETHAILQRMRELAVQSSTDTNEPDRDEIQKEIDQLAQEITRISNDTEFNTQTLLNGGITKDVKGELVFHIGANKGQNVDLGIAAMDAFSLGIARNVTETTAEGNGDRVSNVEIDKVRGSAIVDGANVTLNAVANAGAAATVTADALTVTADTNSAAYNGYTFTVADGTTEGIAVDHDAKTISITLDITNTSTTDISTLDVSYTGTNPGTGGFTFSGIAGTATTSTTGSLAAGVDPNVAITLSDGTNNQVVTVAQDATSVNVTTGDFRGLSFDVSDLANLSNTSDSIDITMTSKIASAAKFDGAEKTDNAFTAGGIDVSTQKSADAAIKTINNALENVSSERSKLGAMQNRLEHTIANLGTSAENLQAAESRIRDLDMADEIMAFTKNNILQQAATAMLAQANMAPQSVLQLLG